MGESTNLSWWEPAFSQEDALAVADVVRSGYVNEGREAARFAKRIGERFGVERVAVAPSGSAALLLALKAFGIGSGDEVIIPSLTFIATASAVELAGARPVTADIRLHDLNIDPASVAERITSATRAIIAVHINGRPADMEALQKLADEHDLALIEDAAQALGSKYHGRSLGAIADIGCISLAPTKIISSGQGGIVLTNDKQAHDEVVRFKDHGRLSRAWNYHPQVGFNFKFPDILAALANSQLDRLDGRLHRARQHFRHYADGLAGTAGVTMLETDMDAGVTPLWVDALVQDSAGLIDYLSAKHQIDCRPFWPAIHLQEACPGQPDCPRAARAAASGVWFPSGAGKQEQDMDRVIDAVADYYR